MDERPRREPGVARLGRRHIGSVTEWPVERRARLLARGFQGCIVGVVELGSVHNLEIGSLAHREVHICNAHLEETASSRICAAQFLGEHEESVGGNGRQEASLVAEVVDWRSVGDAKLAGEIAETQVRESIAFDDVECAVDQRTPQVAVVVGACGIGHTNSLPA